MSKCMNNGATKSKLKCCYKVYRTGSGKANGCCYQWTRWKETQNGDAVSCCPKGNGADNAPLVIQNKPAFTSKI